MIHFKDTHDNCARKPTAKAVGYLERMNFDEQLRIFFHRLLQLTIPALYCLGQFFLELVEVGKPVMPVVGVAGDLFVFELMITASLFFRVPHLDELRCLFNEDDLFDVYTTAVARQSKGPCEFFITVHCPT